MAPTFELTESWHIVADSRWEHGGELNSQGLATEEQARVWFKALEKDYRKTWKNFRLKKVVSVHTITEYPLE